MVNIDPQSEEGARGRRIATGGRGDPVNSDPKEPLIHKKGRGQEPENDLIDRGCQGIQG